MPVAGHEAIAVVFDAAASLATEIAVEGRIPVAIDMGDTWDAADITFKARREDGTAKDVYTDEGTEVNLTVAANRYVVLTGAQSDALAGCTHLTARSGTTALAVAQSGGATLYLVCK